MTVKSKRVRLITLWVVLFLSLAPAAFAAAPAKPISTSEAERLVNAWIDARYPAKKRPPHPSLTDVTPAEVRERLHGQVFRIQGYAGSTDEPEAYFVAKGRVCPLTIGFGGSGLDSMCVCDLDGDGKPELAYAYSWGSGMHRSQLAILRPDVLPLRPIVWRRAVPDDDLVLTKDGEKGVAVAARRRVFEKRQDGNAAIGAANAGGEDGRFVDVLLGSLKLKGKGKAAVLELKWDPKAPPEIRRAVERFPGATAYVPGDDEMSPR